VAKEIQPTIFQRFFRTETAGGSVLLLFGIAALALANSPLAGAYQHLWEIPLTIGISKHSLSLTLGQWINEGLMAVFFLLVGLEIKRELIVGELASARKAALPIACAIGGMIVPAAIYLMFNPTGLGARGWGIPVATDIAFALGALALVAPDAPIGARVFLTALAIVDDMGAVLVIAFFYSSAIAWGALGGAALMLLILVGFNATGVRQLWPYLFVGALLWYLIHESGIHATVAGVLLAFTVPAHTRRHAAELSCRPRALFDRVERSETDDFPALTGKERQENLLVREEASHNVAAPSLRLEHALHNLSAFVVMPLFAFANAGVKIPLTMEHAEIGLGVLAGLFIGKPLGIMATAWLAVSAGIAKLPRAVSWTSLLSCAWLAGIGFTMSLFITFLAFDDTALVYAAKRGVLMGSLLAGIGGAIVSRIASAYRDDR
jgi:NhaA family Na+:H+ antiporter